MPRFKVDENLPSEVASLFRQEGHDTQTVLDERMGGEPDEEIIGVCRREKRALITLDRDFEDIRAYPPREHAGLIVLRMDHQDKPRVLRLVRSLLPLLKDEPLAGRLWIVEERGVRIRA